MNAKADAAQKTLTVSTTKLGRYHVQASLRATEFTITQQSPSKTFTPNGDGVNDVMTIFFENPRTSEVTSAKVYDLYGAEVADLKPGAAVNSYEWDGKDKNGNLVTRGVYVYQITIAAEGKVLTGTMAVAR
jgi:gliding motility-associated-like protein